MREKPTRDELRELEGCVCLALRRTTRALTQAYDAALRPLGVRVTQLPILTAVARQDRVPVATLAEMLGMDRTTLVRNVRPLERDGLVERGTEEGSRRSELRSTAKGRKMLARAYPLWHRVQERAAAQLPDPRWRTTLRDLEAAMHDEAAIG